MDAELTALRAQEDARFAGEPATAEQLEQNLYRSYYLGFLIDPSPEACWNYRVAAHCYAAVLALAPEDGVNGQIAAAAVAGYKLLEELLRWGDITVISGCRRSADYYTTLCAELARHPAVAAYADAATGEALRARLLHPEAINALRDAVAEKRKGWNVKLTELPEVYRKPDFATRCARAEEKFAAQLAGRDAAPLPLPGFVQPAAPEAEPPQPVEEPVTEPEQPATPEAELPAEDFAAELEPQPEVEAPQPVEEPAAEPEQPAAPEAEPPAEDFAAELEPQPEAEAPQLVEEPAAEPEQPAAVEAEPSAEDFAAELEPQPEAEAPQPVEEPTAEPAQPAAVEAEAPAEDFAAELEPPPEAEAPQPVEEPVTEPEQPAAVEAELPAEEPAPAPKRPGLLAGLFGRRRAEPPLPEPTLPEHSEDLQAISAAVEEIRTSNRFAAVPQPEPEPQPQPAPQPVEPTQVPRGLGWDVPPNEPCPLVELEMGEKELTEKLLWALNDAGVEVTPAAQNNIWQMAKAYSRLLEDFRRCRRDNGELDPEALIRAAVTFRLLIVEPLTLNAPGGYGSLRNRVWTSGGLRLLELSGRPLPAAQVQRLYLDERRMAWLAAVIYQEVYAG